MVDVESNAPRQLAEGVVRQPGQVRNRVHAVEVLELDIAQVFDDDRIVRPRRRPQ
jgi:hypothetical protein